MDPWDRVFRKSGKVAWRMVDDDGVLLNLTTGYYYTLNEVGRFFWESLDGRKKLSEIHGDLLTVRRGRRGGPEGPPGTRRGSAERGPRGGR